jgi:hypothetical protein
MIEQMNAFLLSSYKGFGLSGSLLIGLVVLAAALAYSGRGGERYSFFNHFISELGELGVSRGARAFNAALIAGGLLLAPFMIGLGLTLGSVWGLLALAAGLWAALSILLVGVFPMNDLGPHSRAATSFFRAGLVMEVLFSAAVLLQPAGSAVISPYVNLFSLLAAAAYGSFLYLLMRKPFGEEVKNKLDPTINPQRPAFWLLPALEWAVFFTTILWMLGVAVFA